MTLEEIREVYPSAAELIHWLENDIHAELSFSHWRRGMTTNDPQFTPERLTAMHKSHAATIPPDSPKAALVQQLDHPDFLKYVRAKLGCM